MVAKMIFRTAWMGLLTWIIPFAISFLFYKPGGELTIPYDLFKSIMIVVASVTGCYFLYRYFKFVETDFIFYGFIVGLSWFALNILFDLVLLVPLMKVTYVDYFFSIGLRYTVIPAMSITMGMLVSIKAAHQHEQ